MCVCVCIFFKLLARKMCFNGIVFDENNVFIIISLNKLRKLME